MVSSTLYFLDGDTVVAVRRCASGLNGWAKLRATQCKTKMQTPDYNTQPALVHRKTVVTELLWALLIVFLFNFEQTLCLIWVHPLAALGRRLMHL